MSDLKLKEQSKAELEGKLKKLSETINERSVKIEYLEKVRKDNKNQESHLRKAVDIKAHAY
jgi:hypothetical protein